MNERSRSGMSGLFLFLTLGAGLFFRFYHLGLESLWLDEGFSSEFTRESVADILRNSPKDTHPPLYAVLLNGWSLVFGRSETALRSLSALFGFLSILAAYKLARRLFSERTARYTALIMSLSLFHVYYSQEARSYTLMLFLAVLSFYFFVRLLDENKKRFAAGYVLSSIFLLYTHNFGLLTLAAQNLLFFGWKIFRRRPGGVGWTCWIGLQVLVALLWSPWIYITIHQTGSISRESWIDRPTWRSLLAAMREYAGGYRLLLLYMTAGFFGLADSLKKKEGTAVSVVLVWPATLIAVIFAVSLMWTPVFVPRYMIATTVPLMMLAARGLAAIPTAGVRRAALFFLVLLCLHTLYLGDRRVDKEQWRQAMTYLDAHAQAGDLVVVNSCGTPVIDYYLKRKDLDIRVFPAAADQTLMLFDWAGCKVSEKNIHEIGDMVASRDRVWLLQSHYFGKEELVEMEFKRLYLEPVDRRQYQGIALTLYGPHRG